MAFECPSIVQTCVLRVTRLDECGVTLDPLVPNSRVQMSAFNKIEAAADTVEGSRIRLKNACGQYNTNFRGQDRTLGFNLTLTINGTQLPLLEILLDIDLFESGITPGDFTGGVLPDDLTRPNPNPKMLEGFSLNGERSTCGQVGAGAFEVNLWPFTSSWALTGTKTFDDGTGDVWVLSGYAQNNPLWVPSYPGPTFPSWVPGGGDPDSDPDGAPPPILPAGVDADEWTLDQQAQIQAGGPWAWNAISTLPAAVDCDYFGEVS